MTAKERERERTYFILGHNGVHGMKLLHLFCIHTLGLAHRLMYAVL